MDITVVGAGYVGLSLAVLFAEKNSVTVIDTNSEKLEKIGRGVCPLAEKELSQGLEHNRENIRAVDAHDTEKCREAYSRADFIIMAVPTDYDEKNETFNTRILSDCIEKAVAGSEKAVIVIKSTIPVGYTKSISRRLDTDRIIFSPEFMREGKSLYDVTNPSRIITGYPEGRPGAKNNAEYFKRKYRELVKNGAPCMTMRSGEAEAVKLFSNTYLAMRVAFFNELDAFAQKTGLVSESIIRGVCADPRIGEGYANPSFGYGGYCLPKDTKQLAGQMRDIPGALIKAIPQANEERIKSVAEDIASRTDGVIGIYGLSMKAGSDNARASSAGRVADELTRMGRKVVVYDPSNRNNAYGSYMFANNLEDFVEKADIIAANRIGENDRLYAYMGKNEGKATGTVYTRDIFGEG